MASTVRTKHLKEKRAPIRESRNAKNAQATPASASAAGDAVVDVVVSEMDQNRDRRADHLERRHQARRRGESGRRGVAALWVSNHGGALDGALRHARRSLERSSPVRSLVAFRDESEREKKVPVIFDGGVQLRRRHPEGARAGGGPGGVRKAARLGAGAVGRKASTGSFRRWTKS